MSDRIEEIRAADRRCSRPEPGTSEWHRHELLDIIAGLTSEAHLPIEHDLVEVLRVKVAQAVSLDVLRRDVISVLDRVAVRMRRDAGLIGQRSSEVAKLAEANASLGLALVDATRGPEDPPAPPLELTVYVLSAEESFTVQDDEAIKPPDGHGTLVVCAPMETVRAVTEKVARQVLFVFPHDKPPAGEL